MTGKKVRINDQKTKRIEDRLFFFLRFGDKLFKASFRDKDFFIFYLGFGDNFFYFGGNFRDWGF